MNELDAIRALDDTVARRVEELDVAAERLRSAITDDGTTSLSVWTRVANPRRRRWLVAAAAAVVVAITAGALAIAHTASNGANANPAGQPGPVSSTPPVLTPVALLQKMVTAAEAQAGPAPRPDQFLYVQQPGYQAWLSIDGTHDGLIDNGEKTPVPGCRDGVEAGSGQHPGPIPCTPDPAYLSDAPTTAAAMAQYIVAQAGSNEPAKIGKVVFELLGLHYLAPAAQAAVFEALTTSPALLGKAVGFTIVTPRGGGGSVREVTFEPIDDSSLTLVFDVATYAFLGVSTAKALPGPNELQNYRLGIVDAVGQLP